MNKPPDLPHVSFDPDDYEDVDIHDEESPELTEAEIDRLQPADRVLGEGFVSKWNEVRKKAG